MDRTEKLSIEQKINRQNRKAIDRRKWLSKRENAQLRHFCRETAFVAIYALFQG